jgi:hypothetical protein
MSINEQYLQCITWYTGTCGVTLIGLLYGLDPMVIEIYDCVMKGFGSNGCFVTDTLCLNGDHGNGFANSVGHRRSNSVGLLVYDTMCTIFETPILYYRSLRTTPTLPRRG